MLAPAFASGLPQHIPATHAPGLGAAAVDPNKGNKVPEVALATAASAAVAAVASLGRRSRRAKAHRLRAALRRVQVRQAAQPAPSGGYCVAVEQCLRRKTRTVNIGGVKVGSEHPIATQTMANTLTHDVEATVAQIKKCADAGVDIVRVTVQGMREAKACEFIKERLLADGYTTPIVADIHFTPKVALVCADFVDKVRVNPGNFTEGRKSFDTIQELTDQDIKEAQDEIEEALVPLVLKLKEQGKALRIGVNHGSLSERILFQYGDSPEGMVASAVEFGEICRKYDFHNFLFSMKASNPQVMITAYRSLAREMYKRGWDYPLHLGVTEAGGGADGRIKSAVGIGALLLDGLGDTMRVSLTEDPEKEAKPCLSLRQVANAALGKGVPHYEERSGRRDGIFSRRKCEYPLDIPLNKDGSVLARATSAELAELDTAALCTRFGLRFRADGDMQKDWKSIDVVVVGGALTPAAAKNVRALLDVPVGVVCEAGPHVPEGATLLHEATSVRSPLKEQLGGHAVIFAGDESVEKIRRVVELARPRLLVFRPDSQDAVVLKGRRFFANLSLVPDAQAIPCMFWFRYSRSTGLDDDDLVIRASAEFGSLFVDGMGEGILWDTDGMSSESLREASFNLLQASRMRISKTEFISCPSCGRTLFNLQATTAMIQKRTGHLPGVRIAVMGCIVNGPGEMADADFGYVGSGVGKVDLYVGYECVQRGIDSDAAVEKLVDLIKVHGRWQEPPDAEHDAETLTDVASEVGAVAAF